MRTKGEIVNRALSLIGISPIVVGAESEDVELSLFTLEVMVARWLNEQVYLGYRFSYSPKMIDIHGVNRVHWDTLIYNLARLLSVHYAVNLNPVVRNKAVAAMSGTLARLLKDQQESTPYPDRMPLGGYTELRYATLRSYYSGSPNQDGFVADYLLRDGEKTFISEDFTDYLLYDETIDEFIVVGQEQLTLTDRFNSPTQVSFTVETENLIYSNNIKRMVLVRISTTRGRITTRAITFEIESERLLEGRTTQGDVLHENDSPFDPVINLDNLPPNAQIDARFDGTGTRTFATFTQPLSQSTPEDVMFTLTDLGTNRGVTVFGGRVFKFTATSDNRLMTLKIDGHALQGGNRGFRLVVVKNRVVSSDPDLRVTLPEDGNFVIQGNLRVSEFDEIRFDVQPLSTNVGEAIITLDPVTIQFTNLGF